MALTQIGTEKVYGRISNVQIGYDATHGVDIIKGILRFEYARVHDATPQFTANTKTSGTVFQPHSHFTWKLIFLSDVRIAFFATDVQAAGGNQYALNDNGDSNKIEYFKVILPIEDQAGVARTRTYTITNGVCTRNSTEIGDDEDAQYVYEGVAEYISYSDA
jgi:hypothetical protein